MSKDLDIDIISKIASLESELKSYESCLDIIGSLLYFDTVPFFYKKRLAEVFKLELPDEEDE